MLRHPQKVSIEGYVDKITIKLYKSNIQVNEGNNQIE